MVAGFTSLKEVIQVVLGDKQFTGRLHKDRPFYLLIKGLIMKNNHEIQAIVIMNIWNMRDYCVEPPNISRLWTLSLQDLFLIQYDIIGKMRQDAGL